MFTNNIELIPPFSREAINKFFRKSRGFFDGDYSFEMTSAILFHKRKPNFQIEVIKTNAPSMIHTCDKNNFTFLFVDSGENPDEYLEAEFKGEYIPLPKMELLTENNLGQKIYVRRFDNRNVIAFFSNRFTIQHYHVLQSLIPKYFPSVFNDAPATQEEMSFLFTLMNQRDTAYRKGIETALQDEGLKRFLLKHQLIGFEKTIRTRKYVAAENTVRDFQQKMNECLMNYQRYWSQKNDARIIADGLKYAVEHTEDETEFEDYICENKHLTNINLSDEGINFIIKTFVDPYLPDDWDILSDRGTIFEDYDNYDKVVGNKENLKLLLDAIFSRNHSLKLKVCGFIEMNFRRGSCDSRTGYNYTQADPNMRDYIPNGHLQEFNCFGQNKTEILAAMEEGDAMSAVECCINVVRRENVSESATFVPFVRSLVRCKGKCIVSEEDGREMTPEQAIEYLKEKMKNEATSELAGEEISA